MKQKFLQIHKKSKCHKQASSVVAARSKAKAEPQPRELVGTTATIPMHERRWIDIEPSEQILAAYDLSKKVISLLRHNRTVQREKDGAIEFFKIKFHLRNHHSQIHNWSNDRWKACLAAGGGSIVRRIYGGEHDDPMDGQGDGVPKVCTNRRRRTREGPEPACVQTPSCFEVAHAG